MQRQNCILEGYTAQMGDNAQLTAAHCACVCVCMYVYVRAKKKICWLKCTGMSDDWMIYSSELYEKWIKKKKKK